MLAITFALCGCASTSGDGLFDKAMQVAGLSKPPPLPELPVKEVPLLDRKVTLRLHAGERLNTDAAGRSLSVVARIYKLRSESAFLQATYESFQSDNAIKGSAIEQDVVDVRELVLTPGQHHEVVETVPLSARYVGVVMLFRAPAEGRWRFVFESKSAAVAGVTLGVHGCGMSVAQGHPVGAAPESTRMAGVRCL